MATIEIAAPQTQENLILCTDSYKVGHHLIYPAGMSFMQDYFAARGGKYPRTMHAGLQYFMLHFLTKRVTVEDVFEARDLFAEHFGTDRFFPFQAWMKVATVYDGRLPIRIRALPEGTVVNVGVAPFTVESLDDELAFIASWVEGLLLKVWYPTIVATADFHTKLELFKRAALTAENPLDVIKFQLHCFGYRGVSSDESAKIGGIATMFNFYGTDTVPALVGARQFYGESCAGFSIFASEHSTITIFGNSDEGEIEAYRQMIRAAGKEAIFACVSDGRDIYNAVENIWGGVLRDEVRAMNAVLVIRPDSGDPVEVVTRLVQILDRKFGSTENAKGYKVLNKVRVIQGDGINHDGVIGEILDSIIALGFSSENVNFGMGGGRLQQFNRDTNKHAMKCGFAVVDGEPREVVKDPVTASDKKSKRGYVDTIMGDDGEMVSVDRLTEPHPFSEMEAIYEMGDVLLVEDLATIRRRADSWFRFYAGLDD